MAAVGCVAAGSARTRCATTSRRSRACAALRGWLCACLVLDSVARGARGEPVALTDPHSSADARMAGDCAAGARRRAALRPRVRAAVGRALLAAALCASLLRPAAASDMAGYAPPEAEAAGGNASAPRVRVGSVADSCTGEEADLAPLLALTLDRDIAAWRARAGAAGAFAPAQFEALARGAWDPGHSYRLVMIHNNSWLFFAHCNASCIDPPRAAGPEAQAAADCSAGWGDSARWWFQTAVQDWGWSFPGARGYARGARTARRR
jgi:hypothetical protein